MGCEGAALPASCTGPGMEQPRRDRGFPVRCVTRAQTVPISLLCSCLTAAVDHSPPGGVSPPLPSPPDSLWPSTFPGHS